MQVIYIISDVQRTSILLPLELRSRANRQASRLGISFGELVRRALADLLDEVEQDGARDAFFADGAVYSGEIPSGASIHHDEHLYPRDGQ
jgi:predicted DNA-binding protein